MQPLNLTRLGVKSSPPTRRTAASSESAPTGGGTCVHEDVVDLQGAADLKPKMKLSTAAKWGLAVQTASLLVSLGNSASIGSQLMADPVLELVKDDHDITQQQVKDLQTEFAQFDRREVAFVADRGARLHVTSTDAEALDLLKTADPLTSTISFQQMTRDTETLRNLSDNLTKDPVHRALSEQIAQLRKESGEEMRKAGAGMGGMGGGMGFFGGFGGFGGGGLLGGIGNGRLVDSAHQPMMGNDSLTGLQTAAGACNNGGMAALMQAQAAAMAQQQQQKPTRLQELGMKTMEVAQQRRELVLKALQSSGFKEAQLAPPGMDTVESLVQRSGARTPEERAEYRGLLMSINGGRIELAQKSYLDQTRSNLEQMPESKFKETQRGWYESSQKNPDSVFIDLEDNLILLPRVQYAHLDGGKLSLRVPPGSQLEEDTAGALGLHIPASGTIQVDSQSVDGKVGVSSHELGHSIMHHLRAASPEFAKDWGERLGRSWADSKAHAQCGGAVNTNYGLTNTFEYFADGVRSYKTDPDKLKSVDPTLHQLVEDALGEARRVQGHKEHRKEALGAAWLGLSAVSAYSMALTLKEAKEKAPK